MIRHTISLPETMSQNISSLLDDGSYGGMSDYVRDLVRKDLERRKAEQRKEAILELRKLLAEGKASGIGTKSMEELKAEARTELGL